MPDYFNGDDARLPSIDKKTKDAQMTNAALVKKVLANSEPSTNGPSRQILRRKQTLALRVIADVLETGPISEIVIDALEPARTENSVGIIGDQNVRN